MGIAAQLASSAFAKLLSGFRPSTLQQYRRMWADFISFQAAAGLPSYQVNVTLLLSFLEYLHENNISVAQLQNNLSAIRAMHIAYGLETAPFKDERLPLFLKAIRIHRPLNPRVLAHLDIPLLEKILYLCDHMQFPQVFKPLYLLIFFSFLRMSNVLPHAVTQFDFTRHLARADVIFGATGAVLLIKWSKTLQNRRDVVTISLPDLQGSHLCPVSALKAIFQIFPGSDNSPVFVIPRNRGLVPLTDSVARKHLKDVSGSLGLNPSLTFHDFRRGGAVWAFQNGVPLEHIMKHGTWKSDSIWTYLSSAVTAVSPVPLAFQQALRH